MVTIEVRTASGVIKTFNLLLEKIEFCCFSVSHINFFNN